MPCPHRTPLGRSEAAPLIYERAQMILHGFEHDLRSWVLQLDDPFGDFVLNPAQGTEAHLNDFDIVRGVEHTPLIEQLAELGKPLLVRRARPAGDA
jgi:hypothetical protein